MRAITPLGYMPSTYGSAYLFELCPDQLPPGFTFTNASSHHHHHHDNSDAAATPSDSADLCDFGHLLVSVIGVEASAIEVGNAILAVTNDFAVASEPELVTISAYRSRAPPARVTA